MNPGIKFKKLSPKATLPTRGSAQSAGLDLYASESATLYPGEWCAVATGLSMALPSGCEGQIRPRSGLALKKGLTVLNAPGTVDADYRGEVKVILVNHSDSPVVLEVGDRIAQLVVQRVEMFEPVEVESLDDTARGDGGFGSTGK